jgi:L-malate glycosyltransferase
MAADAGARLADAPARTVLYVNHTSRMAGGERSLLTLVAGLPPTVRPVIACPPGELAQQAAAQGVVVERVPGTDSSLRLHPWHTPRGVAEMGRAALAVRRLARRVGADLVHANSIRAGIAASLAARAGGPPAIVHVRDCVPPSTTTRLARALIARGAAAVVANSAYTGNAFGILGTRPVHSPVDLSRFDPAKVDGARSRTALGLSPDDIVLAVVAQITPWKGQIDAIRALARLRAAWPSMRLLIVGSPTFVERATRYDNRAYLRELHGLVAREQLEPHVRFLGDRDDVPEVLATCDVLLAPSWEEPFGRSIVEAMAMGVPVVATSVGGPAEIIRDGVDGLLVPPRRPERWAEAVERLVVSPATRREMGREARSRTVERFGVPEHVASVLAVYDAVVGGG